MWSGKVCEGGACERALYGLLRPEPEYGRHGKRRDSTHGNVFGWAAVKAIVNSLLGKKDLRLDVVLMLDSTQSRIKKYLMLKEVCRNPVLHPRSISKKPRHQ